MGIDAFLQAIAAGDAERARAETKPGIAAASLHAAAALGDLEAVRRRLVNGTQLAARAGDPPAAPLMWLCYSPFGDEAPARVLLAAGADPNTRDGGQYQPPGAVRRDRPPNGPRWPACCSSGRGSQRRRNRFMPPSNSTSRRSSCCWSTASTSTTPATGATRRCTSCCATGTSAPEQRQPGLRWLLDHGADPNVPCAGERESSLHVAVRRGQAPEIVRLLLDHGADVHARRGDGRSAWLLATRGGNDELVKLLETAGAAPEQLSQATC